MNKHPWFTQKELKQELSEEEWEERLRRRKASKEARGVAEATLEREERKERRERPSRAVLGVGKGVKKAVEAVKERKFLAEEPWEEDKKVGKLKVAGRVVGGLAGEVAQKGGRAAGRAAKRVALEAPGFVAEKAPVVAEKGQVVIEKEIGGVARATTGVIRALTKIQGAMPKGITHPDNLIKNKKLYGLGEETSEKLSPIGRKLEDPMDLYRYRKPTAASSASRVAKDAIDVLNAMRGAEDIGALSVQTGLDPQKVVRALGFLKHQGYDTKAFEEA